MEKIFAKDTSDIDRTVSQSVQRTFKTQYYENEQSHWKMGQKPEQMSQQRRFMVGTMHKERWYWWTYLQGSSRDTDIEKRLVDTVWEGMGAMNWDSSMKTYTLPYVKYIVSGNLLFDRGSSI